MHDPNEIKRWQHFDEEDGIPRQYWSEEDEDADNYQEPEPTGDSDDKD